MTKCLRCGAGAEWIEGKVKAQPADDDIAALYEEALAFLGAASQPSDALREAVIAAYKQGALDVHQNYRPDRAPDFTEAAHDYASALGGASQPSAAPWQPIETAPKDGSLVVMPYPLLRRDGELQRYEMLLARWNGVCWDRDIGWCLHQTPAHWLPIPAYQPVAAEPPVCPHPDVVRLRDADGIVCGCCGVRLADNPGECPKEDRV